MQAETKNKQPVGCDAWLAGTQIVRESVGGDVCRGKLSGRGTSGIWRRNCL